MVIFPVPYCATDRVIFFRNLGITVLNGFLSFYRTSVMRVLSRQTIEMIVDTRTG